MRASATLCGDAERSTGDTVTSPDPGTRSTKAERKEQARVERDQIAREMAARNRRRTIWFILGTSVIAAVVAVLVLTASDEPTDTPIGDPGLPGILTTIAPWPANLDQLAERLALLDLPGLSEVVNHTHTPLLIFVNGERVDVPASLGFDEANAVFSPLHTHDTSGAIHIEADDAAFVATLGQLMDVWGVRFDGTCIGGHCEAGDQQLRVFSGGEEVTGDPRATTLDDAVVVVIAFGTGDELPDPIPTTFETAQ